MRADADGDLVPDQLGREVTVQGTVTAEPVSIGRTRRLLSIQDDTAGITVIAPPDVLPEDVTRGDFLKIRGEITQFSGGTQLTADSCARLGKGAPPEPVRARAAEAAAEPFEGRLVRLQGRLEVPPDLLANRRGAVLQDETGRINVNVSSRFLKDPQFAQRLLQGGKATLTGIVGQRDRSAPFSEGYRLYPRDAHDFQFTPVPPYRAILLGSLIALLLAAGSVFYFRQRFALRSARKMQTILEQSRASEAALQEREAYLRVALKQVRSVLWATDQDLRLTLALGSELPGIELPPNPVQGASLADYFGEAYAELLPIARCQDAAAGHTVSFEAGIRDRVFQVRVEPVRAEDGTICGTVGIALDITEQREAAQALLESQERFRIVFENAALGIFLLDAEGHILATNPTLERMLGYGGADFRCLRLTDLSQTGDREAGWSRFQAMLAGEGTYELEQRLLRQDGSKVWGHVTISAARDDKGCLLFAVGVVEEITARKQGETRDAVLLKLGQQFNAADCPVEVARVVLTAAGELLGWSRSRLDLIDADEEHATPLLRMDYVQGRPLVTPDGGTRFEVGPLIRQLRMEGYVLSQPEAHRFLDPEWSHDASELESNLPTGSFLSVAIRSGDRTAGVISLQQAQKRAYCREDIATLQALADYCAGALERTRAETARRELQEQLIQAQKMEAIGRLAGGVAHDFNNMLAVINGYSQLLLDRTTPGSVTHEQLGEVRSAGERAAALTRQLLMFSRKSIAAPEKIDLGQAVNDLAKMLRRLIGEHISLQLSLAPGHGKIQADRAQIDQVLLNLVVNARDAMPGGGTLTLEVENERVAAVRRPDLAALPPGEYVVLRVMDTGCGMPPEVRSQIFEPFFTTKGVGEGTGLGLATVYGIIKQSEGEIVVDSREGAGTCFSIFLPRVDSVAAPLIADDPTSQVSTGSGNVLLVEDDNLVRGLVRTILEGNGYQVWSAPGPAEALRIAHEYGERLDLLLTDVVMPEMSGPALGKQVQALAARTRILYMSGYTYDAFARQDLEIDDTAFIQKPFSPTALLGKVRELLHH